MDTNLGKSILIGSFIVFFGLFLIWAFKNRTPSREELLSNNCSLVGVRQTGEYIGGLKSSKRYETVKTYLCPDIGIQMVVVHE